MADVYLPQDVSENTLDGYIPLNLETMAVLDCDKVILINHGSSGEKDSSFKRLLKRRHGRMYLLLLMGI
ncbi:MAG: hypothetical protein ACLSXY_01710 [Veillonella sp.]